MNRLCSALLALAVLAGASFAQNDPAPSGPVVELPKFVVTDSRELPPPEAWRYATMPGFEILTNASDKATQRLLRDFDMFRQALGYVWQVPNRPGPPTYLIISGRGDKFDAFVPKGKAVPDAGLASLFLKEAGRAAIVIDLQSTTLNILNVDGVDDPATGTDSSLIAVEHDKQLYREYIRYLLSQAEPRPPAWFMEGLAQIIMKMRFDKRWIEFARLEEANTVSAQAAMTAELNALTAADDPDAALLPGAPAEDRDFPAALARRRLVPLEQFFAIKHDSPEALNVLGNNVWAKQAYAFVHMCLYGENGKFQKPFVTFLQRLGREPVSETLFKDCFKMSYEDMLMQIRSYCSFTLYKAQLLQSKKGGPDLIVAPAPLALRDATQAEIGRIKGEALMMAGHTAAARATLIAPYVRNERDPELLAALGLFERRHGEEDRARKFLEAAHAEKAKRPEALLELARFRFAEAVAKPAGAQGRLSAAQLRGVLEPLLAARQQPPHQLALYELAGDAWARADVKPTRDDAQVLIDGAMLYPTRLKLVYQAAVLCSEARELRPAHALADHGIKYAPDPGTKKRFEELKAQLPPAPPAPAEASAPAAGAVKPAAAAKP